jgi:SAM-dependent methyltransferase
MSAETPHVDPAVVAYYATFAEESRLATGASRLEFERTREILSRILPPPPACVIDVGGKRHDAGPARLASLVVGDARKLPQVRVSADAVLVMGPLYHLVEKDDRVMALGEAHRVLVPGGVVAVAAISRYASALAGLVHKHTRDPRFVEIRNQDLATGRHVNNTERADFFTTSYLHRPEDLRAELEAAGFVDVQVLGVEGIAEWLIDFDERWDDPHLRHELLEVARRIESEPSIIGMSAHLLGIGRKH